MGHPATEIFVNLKGPVKISQDSIGESENIAESDISNFDAIIRCGFRIRSRTSGILVHILRFITANRERWTTHSVPQKT
jgi:hypothetical protein